MGVDNYGEIEINHGTKQKKKDECTIVSKVYDQCRIQECITPGMIGPARYAGETGCALEGQLQIYGEPIVPPISASAVTIVPDSIFISNIIIVSKTKNSLKKGFYDIDLKIIFRYNLNLFKADGSPINLVCQSGVITPDIPAESIFNKTITLFGSEGGNATISSDFPGIGSLIGSAPYVFVEAKAIELEAKIVYKNPCFSLIPPDCPPIPNSINVAIGLFMIVKLLRLVQLIVKSDGFCKPNPCIENPISTCEAFNNFDFPFEIFNPPQREN